MPQLLGLRTVIYPAHDLDAAKAWFAGVLGAEPYFDVQLPADAAAPQPDGPGR